MPVGKPAARSKSGATQGGRKVRLHAFADRLDEALVLEFLAVAELVRCGTVSVLHVDSRHRFRQSLIKLFTNSLYTWIRRRDQIPPLVRIIR